MRTYESKRFGFKLESFKDWLKENPGMKFNFSSIGSPLAQYIVDTHKTIYGEVTIEYYWIVGKGYCRRGPLPYWALAMGARLAHLSELGQIGIPFTTDDTLAALEGL